MAKASTQLVTVLRETAERVSTGVRYEWGHMAHCNCGHVVQTITQMSGQEVSQTIKHSLDEWTEHANDLCNLSGHAVEDLFTAMYEAGFENQDIIHLEKLSDQKVLNRLGRGVYLQKNKREDLITYLQTMADMMEEDLAA